MFIVPAILIYISILILIDNYIDDKIQMIYLSQLLKELKEETSENE